MKHPDYHPSSNEIIIDSGQVYESAKSDFYDLIDDYSSEYKWSYDLKSLRITTNKLYDYILRAKLEWDMGTVRTKEIRVAWKNKNGELGFSGKVIP